MGSKISVYDAVIVPGGGLSSSNELPPWVKCRFEKAKAMRGDATVITLSAGTPHKPLPMDVDGFPVFESVVAAEWLVEQGVPENKILTDTFSYDTIGNAFFARLMHVMPTGFRNLLVITNEFHLPRTQAIFEWIFSLDGGTPEYSLDYLAVADAGMDKDALNARKQKEERSLLGVQEQARKLTTLADVHRWLFTRHDVYSAMGRPERLQGTIAKTY